MSNSSRKMNRDRKRQEHEDKFRTGLLALRGKPTLERLALLERGQATQEIKNSNFTAAINGLYDYLEYIGIVTPEKLAEYRKARGLDKDKGAAPAPPEQPEQVAETKVPEVPVNG